MVVLKCNGVMICDAGAGEPILCSQIVVMDSGLIIWCSAPHGLVPGRLGISRTANIEVGEVEYSILDDDPSPPALPACDRCNDDPSAMSPPVCPKCFKGAKDQKPRPRLPEARY